MAEEKFGKDSRVWIAEPGETGLDRWSPRELFEDEGIVLEWNQQKLVLVRPNAQKESTIVGDYVARIEPYFGDEAGDKAHAAYRLHEFQTVLTQGKTAVATTDSKLHRWQRRLILAEMVDAATALGRTSDAGVLFAPLAKDNPPQLLMTTIPLPWGDDVLAADLGKIQGLAEKWIEEEQEGLKLLGASWLLTGTKRSTAIQTLETLRSSKTPLISVYSKAQLWRTVPPSEILSDRYPKWLAERDSVALPIQAGPTMLLADRLAQSGQLALAVSEWMRVVTLHSDRYHLKTKAKTKAIATLKQLGRNKEAEIVSATSE